MSADDIYIKKRVTINEFNLCVIAKKALNISTPDVVEYHRDNKVMYLRRLHYMTVADKYGDLNENTPNTVYSKIRKIIKNLWNGGICYPDITGYNFIEDDNENIWIIDFGHAYVIVANEKKDPFVVKFMNGYNGWNPDFA